MTNPAAAMRLLITYVICIPVAGFLGYLLTDPMDYSTMGFIGIIAALLISPIFIRWHYPMMIFGLNCPMIMFFIFTRPPLWEVMAVITLTISLVERALSSERRFISVPSLTWPLFYIAAMTYMTAELTGGISLHMLGGSGGGGRKYLIVFFGIAAYFALTSRVIPKEHRKLFICLYFLSALPAFVSDLFPFLPKPFSYINLFFPPSGAGGGAEGSVELGTTRLGACATTAGVLANFMLVRYGLRGVFTGGSVFRVPLFLGLLLLTMLGGFRNVIFFYAMAIPLLFFLEKLYKTSLLFGFIIGGLLCGSLLVPFGPHLPYTFQRSLSFIPLVHWDASAKYSAEDSTRWRLEMWAQLWPRVPSYLLLGKGCSLSEEDFQSMGSGAFAGTGAQMDASQTSLAISGDYHSGPLSTLIPFGLWGGIGILWLMAASTRVIYRNYRYGDPELRTVNAFLLAGQLSHVIGFFFIFGAFVNDVGTFAMTAGFSIALNQGVCGPKPAPAVVQRFKPALVGTPQPV